ncbi:hypothetical protein CAUPRSCDRAFT_13047 [Caulochytrium protostelioides]|uniref:DUF4219 domain-containing protein n=1 Tax=Caulochytrium protostelioides TaxID=1555241 RepID=A0A4V1ISZ1_9FUNG|nr:hypothetical protein CAUPRSCDRAFT_13047 [Caulochytrium protostelioides]
MEHQRPPKLTSDNFPHWKFTMKVYLASQNLWGVVSGEQPRPVADPMFGGKGDFDELADMQSTWDEFAGKAFSIIAMSLSEVYTQHISLLELNEPHNAWKRLVDLFERDTVRTQLSLFRKLVAMQLAEGQHLQAPSSSTRRS